jgi:hypothetical protein
LVSLFFFSNQTIKHPNNNQTTKQPNNQTTNNQPNNQPNNQTTKQHLPIQPSVRLALQFFSRPVTSVGDFGTSMFALGPQTTESIFVRDQF